MIKLCVRTEFSTTPGGRWKKLGPNSGEEFYESLLEVKFKEACNMDDELLIDLDGAIGYPSSFIDQSFGKLARDYGSEEVLKRIKFKSEDQPSLPQDIIKSMKVVKAHD